MGVRSFINYSLLALLAFLGYCGLSYWAIRDAYQDGNWVIIAFSLTPVFILLFKFVAWLIEKVLYKFAKHNKKLAGFLQHLEEDPPKEKDDDGESINPTKTPDGINSSDNDEKGGRDGRNDE